MRHITIVNENKITPKNKEMVNEYYELVYSKTVDSVEGAL